MPSPRRSRRTARLQMSSASFTNYSMRTATPQTWPADWGQTSVGPRTLTTFVRFRGWDAERWQRCQSKARDTVRVNCHGPGTAVLHAERMATNRSCNAERSASATTHLIRGAAEDGLYGMNLADNLTTTAARHPDQPALRFGDPIVSHSAFDQASTRVASVLQQRGFGVGETCSCFGGRCPTASAAHILGSPADRERRDGPRPRPVARHPLPAS